MSRVLTRPRVTKQDVLVTTGCLVYAAAVGYLAMSSLVMALIVALGGIAIAVTASNMSRFAMVAVAGTWLVQRAPGVDISYTDLIVAAAGCAALIAGVQRNLQPSARLLFRSFALYLALLCGSLAYNHSLRSDLEWFHRIALVGGAVLVGAWLVQSGRHKGALRLLLLVTSVVSAFAVVDSVTSGFQAAYPLWFHKNFVGSMTATMLIVLLAAAHELALPKFWLRAGAILTGAGLVASQSRGGMIAVVVGGLIWFFRTHPDRRQAQWKLAVVVTLGLAVFAGSSITEQIEAGDQHDSINHRREVESVTSELWKANPVTGVGVRFFYRPEYAHFQPPNNVLNEALAEAGFPGLIGFLIFVAGAVMALSRARGDLALAGLCVICARFVHGLFDIYWVAGTTTLPWLIAGMGLAPVAAAQVRERLRPRTATGIR